MKLRAFIGSSSESLKVAEAIRDSLAEIESQVWTDSFFKLSHTTIETLSERVDEFDLGIFVFAEDDKVRSRKVDYSATRDNVIFETGLFCGRLGPKRTFVVRPKSKSFKWLSDLNGFTPAWYDPKEPDLNKAVVKACEEIRKAVCLIGPRPGVYASADRKPLYDGWWTYGGSDVLSTAVDEEGIQLVTDSRVGLKFPRHDNLNAPGRYCAVRVASTPNATEKRFYISLKSESERFLLSLCDSHAVEGWGTPANEFMIRIPHIAANKYRWFLFDLEELAPYVGPAAITGFRIRSGLKFSHFCVFDKLPSWLRDADKVAPSDAPLITIDRPRRDEVVGRDFVVEGKINDPRKTLLKHTDIQIFVLSTDNFWWPQGHLTLTQGRWKVKAYFGTADQAGGADYQIAAITTNGKPAKEKVAELPQALGKSIVRVTRK